LFTQSKVEDKNTISINLRKLSTNTDDLPLKKPLKQRYYGPKMIPAFTNPERKLEYICEAKGGFGEIN
jgi:hypothetical protein